MIEIAGDQDIAAPVVVTIPAAADPLLCKVSLPLCAVFHPLGFSVEIRTNEKAVLDAAIDSWGQLTRRRDVPPMRIEVVVEEETGSLECPSAPTVRAQDYLLSIVADGRNQAICDLKAGAAYMWLSRAAVAHRSYLRYHFLDSAALVLLTARYTTPIHAACVSRNGRGVLLCGDSGAGKSTLAYGCARAGWLYTSDDASYIVRDVPRARVIGNARQFRFRSSARELFPELRGRALTPRAQGKPSIEVATSDIAGIRAAEEADVHFIVFLRRRPGAIAELIPVASEDAMEWFHRALYQTDEIQRLQAESLQQFSGVDAYELHYSSLRAAVELLDELTDGRAEREAGKSDR